MEDVAEERLERDVLAAPEDEVQRAFPIRPPERMREREGRVLPFVDAKGDRQREMAVGLEEGLGTEGRHVDAKVAPQVEAGSA